jgi:hypothetical protein
MVVALSCALALGCGGDSKDSDKDNDGSSGNGGKSGNGGGGNSGNSGSGSGGASSGTGGVVAGGTGGMGGGAVVKNVPCGEKVCAGIDPSSGAMMIGGMAGFRLADTCCVDEAAGTCGAVSSTDMSCQPPPDIDQECPVLAGMPGCCATNNECGIDASLFGRGCASLVTISAMISAQFRMSLGFPDPVDCDGKPIAMDAGMMSTDEDAGM